jgi:hypothetical protein
MPFFPKSAEKVLIRDRDNAVANVARLAAKLHDAEASVIASKSTVQRAALDGDDSGLDAAEAAEHGALRRLSTIGAAHVEAGKLLALLESQLMTIADEKQRRATAASANGLADDLVQAAASFDIAIAELAALTAQASPIVFEANGLQAFATSSQTEVPWACGVVAELLRDHAKAVLSGTAAAMLPKPETPFVPPTIAEPVVRRLFTTRSISWTDAEGMLRVAQKFTDANLPLVAADRAIAARVCVEMTDPARKKNHNQWPGHPDPPQCYSLDEPDGVAAIDATEPHDVVKHSSFVETIGKPYIVRTAGGVA